MEMINNTHTKCHCEAVRPVRASARDGEAIGRRGSLLIIGRLPRSLENAPLHACLRMVQAMTHLIVRSLNTSSISLIVGIECSSVLPRVEE